MITIGGCFSLVASVISKRWSVSVWFERWWRKYTRGAELYEERRVFRSSGAMTKQEERTRSAARDRSHFIIQAVDWWGSCINVEPSKVSRIFT